jgi:hypothetical protein
LLLPLLVSLSFAYYLRGGTGQTECKIETVIALHGLAMLLRGGLGLARGLHREPLHEGEEVSIHTSYFRKP